MQREHEEAEDHEQHVEEPLEHDARQRRADRRSPTRRASSAGRMTSPSRSGSTDVAANPIAVAENAGPSGTRRHGPQQQPPALGAEQDGERRTRRRTRAPTGCAPSPRTRPTASQSVPRVANQRHASETAMPRVRRIVFRRAILLGTRRHYRRSLPWTKAVHVAGAQRRHAASAAPTTSTAVAGPRQRGIESQPESQHRHQERHRSQATAASCGVPAAERRRRLPGRARRRSSTATTASSHTVTTSTSCGWRPSSGQSRCPTSPDQPGAEAEDHVAFRTLRAARRQREPEPLGAGAHVAHHLRGERGDAATASSVQSSQEEDAEADEGRDLRPSDRPPNRRRRRAGSRARSAAPPRRRGCRACRREW